MRYNRVLVRKIEEWADWRNCGAEEIGYPSDTTEARLMEYGAIPSVSGQSVTPAYLGHNGAREVESAVFALPVQEHRVIWCKYVDRYRPDKAIRIFKMSNMDYDSIMDRAHKKLADSLRIRYRDV